MKIENKINLHNKFEIEVKDIETGKIRQRAEAYNLVTNVAVNRLASTTQNNKIAYRIAFGSGSTTPLATNTSLGAYVGNKNATTVEMTIDRNLGIGVLKRKITLLPSEYVGKAISEVGFMSDTSQLITQALLKDSEGNPLSILKTDTDEITIYATLFINARAGNYHYHEISGFDKGLQSILYVNSWNMGSSETIYVTTSPFKATMKQSARSTSMHSAYRSDVKSVANGRMQHSVELSSNDFNDAIFSIGTNSGFFINLLDYPGWTGTYVDLDIGIGDGVTTEFDTPLSMIDSSAIGNEAKVDGVAQEAQFSSIRNASNLIDVVRDASAEFHIFSCMGSEGVEGGETLTFEFETVEEVSFSGVTGKSTYKFNATTGYRQSQLYYSLDGLNYNIATDCTGGLFEDAGITMYPSPSPKAKFFKIVASAPKDQQNLKEFNMIVSSPPQIKFNTPPPEGSVITARVFCNGIPKTSQNLLRLTVEESFTDGGAV